MPSEKREKHRRDEFAGKNRNRFFLTMIVVAVMLSGCSTEAPERTDTEIVVADREANFSGEEDMAEAERIAETYRDIYEDAVKENTLGSLATMKRIVSRLGENDYVAVDRENQIDMAGAERAEAFCRAVEEKRNDSLTVIEITGSGFRKYDLETEDGNVNVVRGYYQYDQDGHLRSRSRASYQADVWQ